MQDVLWSTGMLAMAGVIGFGPIALLVYAGVVTGRLGEGSEQVRTLINWLIIAVWMLLAALFYAWFGPIGADY